MVVGQKRTLYAHMVRINPSRRHSTELKENASQFAAGPGDRLTVRVPLALVQVLACKKTAVCGCGSMLGNVIARIIPRNWVVTYPRSW